MLNTIDFAYEKAIADICGLNWQDLDEASAVDVAWAYYFFSIQFRENLEIARKLFPDDAKLQDLEREECNTSNLSPWPGVAAPGEAMNHDEFMRRVLTLSSIDEAKKRRFEEMGAHYLATTRSMDDMTCALSITSYEDGGLEATFKAMLKTPAYSSPAIAAFRHFLSEHIRFDSDPDAGHGSMIRHLRPDDRILPLWQSFYDILVGFVPALAR